MGLGWRLKSQRPANGRMKRSTPSCNTRANTAAKYGDVTRTDLSGPAGAPVTLNIIGVPAL